jgi:hypothetical protein
MLVGIALARLSEETRYLMRLRTIAPLTILAVGFGFVLCPRLSAVSYAWDFTGSGGAGSVGNSILFTNGLPGGGPTIKASAWYINAGLFQQAAVGQYSHGLGVCYPGENCSSPNHQTDNSGFDDFVLLEFSSPVDPSTVRVTTTSSLSSQRDTDVSFWLGGNSATQDLNLAGTSVAGLSGLGFGARVDDDGAILAQNGFRDVTIPPTGVFVNKMLFGSKYLDGDDYFKITSMGGSTPDGGPGGVPEPSSLILLGTTALVVFRLATRRTARAR